MSHTKDWGDKIIITLHSDGERRYKKWCKNYRDGSCKYYLGKCTGSAHCEQYKNRYDDGSSTFHVTGKDDVKTVGQSGETSSKSLPLEEYYRRAGIFEKLCGKEVLVRSKPYVFRFGTVVADGDQHWLVEYDGKVHQCDRKTVFRNGAMYVCVEKKEGEE